MMVLYKGKGNRNDFGNYKGISLLSVLGKVLCRVLFDCLLKQVANCVLSESQSCFHVGHDTTDMIFSTRQLQKKCVEGRMDLHQVFIDPRKAFDSVNRNALWRVHQTLGCPGKFLT